MFLKMNLIISYYACIKKYAKFCNNLSFDFDNITRMFLQSSSAIFSLIWSLDCN